MDGFIFLIFIYVFKIPDRSLCWEHQYFGIQKASCLTMLSVKWEHVCIAAIWGMADLVHEASCKCTLHKHCTCGLLRLLLQTLDTCW